MNTEQVNQYYSILEGCGIADFSGNAIIFASGRDRIDLIHRMSTNDLTGMAAGEGRPTVLTTPLARMIDRLLVIELDPATGQAVYLGGAGNGAKVRRWLAGHIFFQDNVTLTDGATDWSRFDLFGAKAAQVADHLARGASGLPPYSVLKTDELIVGRGDPLAGESYFVLVRRAVWAETWGRAQDAGAVAADAEVVEVLRVEAGLPAAGREISEDYIPLEAGLWNAVSFSKGCYTGQEIIARMESRGKLAKQMVGVRLPEGVEAGRQFSGGEVVSGVITSVAHSPRFGDIGLAFIKPANVPAGAPVPLNGGVVTIASLPFTG